MKGGLVFMIKYKMCVGIDKDRTKGKDRLMGRVGKDPYDKLLSKEGGREMDFPGKVLRGFLFISPEGFIKESELD